MPIRSGGPAPYAPPTAVLMVIERYRERGLVAPFTQDVLAKAGVNESLIPRTLKALELLELTDKEGMPTPQLEGLRRATSDEFSQRLAEVVRSVYAEVFAFTDPGKDDSRRVADAFRDFEPIGQRGRMVTLFLGLCQAGEIIPKDARKPMARAAASGQIDRRTGKVEKSNRPGSVGPMARVRNFDHGLIPSAITGLLGALPAEGESWSKDKRDAFVKTFEHVLDFCYPVALESAAATDTE